MKTFDELQVRIRIIKNGESRIFKNWQEVAGITQDQFIDGLAWLCADPCDGGADGRRLTRELGLDVAARRIARLHRTYFEDGSFDGLLDIDSDPVAPGLYHRWEGKISISCKDRV